MKILKKKNQSFTVDPNIFDAQRDIERSLGLKVTIQNKKNNSGKLTIEYKNLDQLELLSKLLKISQELEQILVIEFFIIVNEFIAALLLIFFQFHLNTGELPEPFVYPTFLSRFRYMFYLSKK